MTLFVQDDPIKLWFHYYQTTFTRYEEYS